MTDNASEGTIGTVNGVTYFYPPSPPFDYLLMERNPLRLKVDSAKAGYLNDYRFARSAVTPYRTVSYTATQR